MKECAATDCTKNAKAKSKWCSMHEARLRRHGSLAPTPFSQGPLDERFWRRVSKGEGCWLWQGAINNKGYGQLHSGSRAERPGLRYAHRVSYEIHYGPIPEGLIVLHTCDTPACVNPAHLRVGTQEDNMLDAAAKGRTLPNERNPNAQYSNDLIRQVRRRVATGERMVDVAADTGISLTHVWNVVAGEKRRGI